MTRRRLTQDEIARNKARANEKRKLHRLWAGDSTFAEICEEMGMTAEAVREFADSLGLGERPEPEFYLPTPAEIRLAAARIRSQWTQAEREARLEAARNGRLNEATGRENE
ncbi:MAG: hypothetical protein EBS56_07535 [Planctomycetia bacterium]|nr:hypothetical protein [Planctomycetia bacterium]